jgi:hypothetical protein
MDAETQSHVFEPFFTTKQEGKGTGLGLATTYAIVTRFGGGLTVYSEPGHGSTFKAYLPRVEDAADAAPRVQDRKPARGGETVLVVEDNEQVRTLAMSALDALGYRVIEARDADEALVRTAEHSTIDLVITDVVLPGGMNGRELAERLREDRPELRILFMSGYTSDAIVHRGVLTQELAFIQKPFSPTGLAARVRELLDEREPPAATTRGDGPK